MSSAICLDLDQSKILSSGNGLSDERLFAPFSQSITLPYFWMTDILQVRL